MPIHDWTRVEAGIFHHFHHGWISEISDVLNGGILSEEYYALAEQYVSKYGPDVQATSQVELDYYSHKQKGVAIRHVTGDEIVAMVEIVSPGNKSSQAALRTFVEKAGEILQNQIHLLIVDVHPPTKRDPHGIHGLIWHHVGGEEYQASGAKPLTQASYQCGPRVIAYVVPVAVGDTLADMPLFLKPGMHIEVPLEKTYEAAFQAVPRRWRSVLERPA